MSCLRERLAAAWRALRGAPVPAGEEFLAGYLAGIDDAQAARGQAASDRLDRALKALPERTTCKPVVPAGWEVIL